MNYLLQKQKWLLSMFGNGEGPELSSMGLASEQGLS